MNDEADGVLPGESSDKRARPLRVGCYSGHRYPERPEWVEIDGEKVDVQSIESEWREEDRLAYRVTLRDTRRMVLYYVPNHDFWSGVLLT